MSAAHWARGKAMVFFDWLDSPAGRLPFTAILLVVGIGLVLADERAARRWRR